MEPVLLFAKLISPLNRLIADLATPSLPAHRCQIETVLGPIPKGLCPPAQGCEARATLGFSSQSAPTPTGLQHPCPRSTSRHNPVGVEDNFSTFSQGSSPLATLGFVPESLWDSQKSVGKLWPARKKGWRSSKPGGCFGGQLKPATILFPL